MKIERLSPPPPSQRVQGWCLYRADRWEWECPQQEDELGFVPVPVPDGGGPSWERANRVGRAAQEGWIGVARG